MVYTENHETWCECDNCRFTMFAGFNAGAHEVRTYARDGWTFGKKVLCPWCSEEAGLIKPGMNRYDRRGA